MEFIETARGSRKLCYDGHAYTFNPFPNKPWFLRVCSTSLLKTLWENEKLLVTSNFSFSHSVFYPFRELSANFIKLKIVICKLFQFGSVRNLLFGKGLRPKVKVLKDGNVRNEEESSAVQYW